MQRHRAMPSGTEPLYCRVAAGALPGLQEPLTGSHLLGPVSAAPPGDAIRHGAALLPGGGYALPGLPGPLTRSHLVGPVSAAPPGDAIRHGAALLPGGGYALPGLPGPLTRSHLVGPVSAAPPGDAIRHGAAFMPGGGWRLTRPTVRVMFSLPPSPRREEGLPQALAPSSRATCSALRLSAAARAKLST